MLEQQPRVCQPLVWALGLALGAMVSSPSWGVGSGGLLNLVPQATVTIGNGADVEELSDAKVYVHPMEGSLVIILPREDSVIALDKNKRHAIRMELDAVEFLDSGSIVDVPEDSPYSVLPGNPHFNRVYAQLRLDDGRVLVVSVER